METRTYKMTITNKHNLPETFVKAVTNFKHSGERYSASQLSKSARMVHLEKRHYDEISEDVIDRFWALLGTSTHAILEKGEHEQAISEAYFTEEINGIKISGKSDYYKAGKISDYKVTSVWSYIFRDDKITDWESQLNVYGWLFRKAGYEVNELEIIMILRDFMKSKAGYGNYPDIPIQTIKINLWDIETQEKYIKNRVDYYEKYKDTPDNDLPFCSETDRWVKPAKYAIMKKGRKTAVKLHDTLESAEQHLSNLDEKHYIEKRDSEQWKRCEYCSVSKFCNQFLEGLS